MHIIWGSPSIAARGFIFKQFTNVVTSFHHFYYILLQTLVFENEKNENKTSLGVSGESNRKPTKRL